MTRHAPSDAAPPAADFSGAPPSAPAPSPAAPAPSTAAPSHAALSARLLGNGRTLRDILALAGPDMAPRLIAQIGADLSGTAAALTEALAQRDWQAIRAQTHVLISVSGTIGAMGLHASACAMNEAAHRRDAPALDALSPGVMADLHALVGLVASQGWTA